MGSFKSRLNLFITELEENNNNNNSQLKELPRRILLQSNKPGLKHCYLNEYLFEDEEVVDGKNRIMDLLGEEQALELKEFEPNGNNQENKKENKKNNKNNNNNNNNNNN